MRRRRLRPRRALPERSLDAEPEPNRIIIRARVRGRKPSYDTRAGSSEPRRPARSRFHRCVFRRADQPVRTGSGRRAEHFEVCGALQRGDWRVAAAICAVSARTSCAAPASTRFAAVDRRGRGGLLRSKPSVPALQTCAWQNAQGVAERERLTARGPRQPEGSRHGASGFERIEPDRAGPRSRKHDRFIDAVARTASPADIRISRTAS